MFRGCPNALLFLLTGACLPLGLSRLAAVAQTAPPKPAHVPTKARILFLHHSTGECVWNGGVKEWFDDYNQTNQTDYAIREQAFPKDDPYGWNNYPYDYWNIWVRHAGSKPFKGEPTLEMLTPKYDVITFKHCFPVSSIEENSGKGDVASEDKRIAIYKLQYDALKKKMREFPKTRFIVWTGAALVKGETDEAAAKRAKAFFEWVCRTWDEPNDNIFIWDFRALETEGGLYLKDTYAQGDSHPNEKFSKQVAPRFCRRIVDVIRGDGDQGSITGEGGTKDGAKPPAKSAEPAEPAKPECAPAKPEPPASQPAAIHPGDAWTFDDAEDPAKEKPLWGQGAAYSADGKNHVIKIRFAEGREEDWGEYGRQRIVSSTPLPNNFDLSPYRYLAFRLRADREMEIVLKIVTRPDTPPAGEDSFFWFSAYPRTKARGWEWIVLDLTKLELGTEGEAAYAAAGKPDRPLRLSGLSFAAHQKHEKADLVVDDVVFYRELPKNLAERLEGP